MYSKNISCKEAITFVDIFHLKQVDLTHFLSDRQSHVIIIIKQKDKISASLLKFYSFYQNSNLIFFFNFKFGDKTFLTNSAKCDTDNLFFVFTWFAQFTNESDVNQQNTNRDCSYSYFSDLLSEFLVEFEMKKNSAMFRHSSLTCLGLVAATHCSILKFRRFGRLIFKYILLLNKKLFELNTVLISNRNSFHYTNIGILFRFWSALLHFPIVIYFTCK